MEGWQERAGGAGLGEREYCCPQHEEASEGEQRGNIDGEGRGAEAEEDSEVH